MSLIQIRLVGSSESSWLRTSACPSASSGSSSSTSSRSPSASSPSGRLRSRNARFTWVSGIVALLGSVVWIQVQGSVQRRRSSVQLERPALGGHSHVWSLDGGDQLADLLDLRREQRVVALDRAGRL